MSGCLDWTVFIVARWYDEGFADECLYTVAENRREPAESGTDDERDNGWPEREFGSEKHGSASESPRDEREGSPACLEAHGQGRECDSDGEYARKVRYGDQQCYKPAVDDS